MDEPSSELDIEFGQTVLFEVERMSYEYQANQRLASRDLKHIIGKLPVHRAFSFNELEISNAGNVARSLSNMGLIKEVGKASIRYKRSDGYNANRDIKLWRVTGKYTALLGKRF